MSLTSQQYPKQERMTSKAFEYDESLIKQCALSPRGIDEKACLSLYTLFTNHYYGGQSHKKNRINNNSKRLSVFVRNVIHVHNHNRKKTLHKIGLNQFSDMLDEELDAFLGRTATEYPMSKGGEVHLSGIDSILQLSKKKHKNKHKNNEMIEDWSSEVVEETNGFNFSQKLDWSTNENPDGVSIVHDAWDQGPCGSCWAFSATGSVEASIARNAAFHVYADALREELVNTTSSLMHCKKLALKKAQDAESRALQAANLSVQELIDCDDRYDQGCVGGNPILAFFFIRRYGLTSWENYPYTASQGTCQLTNVLKPIAYVQNWGVLTPNHEANMELVLRYMGPLATGFNGNDPAFLAYKSGIYDSNHCSQDLNHAMLIVGYGQTTTTHSSAPIKYWIARNSWGQGWGENGYIRIARGLGHKGLHGVCGIAQNPSVAIGGTLLISPPPSQEQLSFTTNNTAPLLVFDTPKRHIAWNTIESNTGFQPDISTENIVILFLVCIGGFFVVGFIRRRYRRGVENDEARNLLVVACPASDYGAL